MDSSIVYFIIYGGLTGIVLSNIIHIIRHDTYYVVRRRRNFFIKN